MLVDRQRQIVTPPDLYETGSPGSDTKQVFACRRLLTNQDGVIHFKQSRLLALSSVAWIVRSQDFH